MNRLIADNIVMAAWKKLPTQSQDGKAAAIITCAVHAMCEAINAQRDAERVANTSPVTGIANSIDSIPIATGNPYSAGRPQKTDYGTPKSYWT